MGGDPYHADQRRQDRRALAGAGSARHAPAAGLHTHAGGRTRPLRPTGWKRSLATAGLFLLAPATRGPEPFPCRRTVRPSRGCMVDPMSDQPETVVSWRAISAHCPVVASDGVEVGHVADVAGLPEEDIFHGVVFTHRVLGHHVLAPAGDIDRITERAVYLKWANDATHGYDPFQE